MGQQYGLSPPSTESDTDEIDRQALISKVVSAAKIDPFNSWPVPWQRDLDANFDYLTKSFGPSMFGYEPNDKDFEIFKSQAELALTDPAALHSLMTISTMRKDQAAGKTLPGMNFLWHRFEAIRTINERLRRGDVAECTTQGSIYAVMVLMGISLQWDALDVHEFGPEAINRLIVLKGGMRVINEQYPVLETSIFGMAVLNPGLLRSDLYTASDIEVLNHDQDPRSMLYSVLGFLRASAKLREKCPVLLAEVQRRFSVGTAAHSLMCDEHTIPGIYDDRQHRMSIRLRAHITAYVLCVLTYASQTQVRIFLEHFDFVNQHIDIWKNSLRMFAWALMCNITTGSLMFSMQAWQSYEMLCGGMQMPDHIRYQVLTFCIGILTDRQEGNEKTDEILSAIRSVMFGVAVE